MANLDFLHSIDLQKNLQVQIYNFVMPKLLMIYWPVLSIILHTLSHTFKNIYNQLFVNYIHLILMPKVDICALDKKCV